MRLVRAGVVTFSILGACMPALTPVGVSPMPPPPSPQAPAAAGATRAAPAPAASTFYAPDEAIRDALSGPLELVGVGEWPGVFRRLTCIYRNQRVFVIDEKCSNPREPDQLAVHVLSPTRGRATIYAEAGAPIGSVKRAAYKTFALSSMARRPPPAALDLEMTYAQVIAYETDKPGAVPAFCTAYSSRPEPHCTKTVSITPAAYAQQTSAFLANPPDAWYDLVRELVAQRKVAHASIRPAALPVEQLRAWGASWARDLDITVTEDKLKFVGNTAGIFAAIMPTADGGAVIVGTSPGGGPNDAIPAVVRADANGKKLWVKRLPQKGFVLHEDTAVIATADAVYVHAEGYPNRGWKPVHRLIKLDHQGNVKWEWAGRGKDKYKIPQVVRARITQQGTVVLTGLIQLVADGDVHAWAGEVDANGKTLRDEVGAILPDHGASLD